MTSSIRRRGQESNPDSYQNEKLNMFELVISNAYRDTYLSLHLFAGSDGVTGRVTKYTS